MPTRGAVISKEDGKTRSKCGETGQCLSRGLYYRLYCENSCLPSSPKIKNLDNFKITFFNTSVTQSCYFAACH